MSRTVSSVQEMPRRHHTASQAVSTRTVGGQSCCVVAVHVPTTNCGDDCLKGHRHAADFNVGRFLNQLQTQYFDVQKKQYPILVYHDDLHKTQKRMLRAKTLSAVLFYKISLNPMQLPMYLRPMFPKIVNATAAAHRGGDLFRTEMNGAPYRGFQQRMMSRFLAGQLFSHVALKGYKYVMRFDAVNVRIQSAFPYDPFEKVQRSNAVYGYRSITQQSTSLRVNPVMQQWMQEHKFSGNLIRKFTYQDNGKFYYDGRAFSRDVEVFKMEAFQSAMHTYMFDSMDRTGAFLLGDSDSSSLEDGQFRMLSVAFLEHANPKSVFELTDLPLQYTDVDEPYV